MSYIGYVVLFFLAGMVQVGYSETKSLLSAFVFLVVLIAGIYILGWWALLIFLIGASVGQYIWFKSDFYKKRREADRKNQLN